MNKKINVLWLCSWYPTKNEHFSGTFIRRQAIAVAETNLVDVSVLFVKEGKGYAIETEKTELLFEVFVYYPSSNNPVIKYFNFFRACWKGFQTIRHHKRLPDLVHLNVIFRMGIIALMIKLFYKIPYVVTEHWTGYKPTNSDFQRRPFIARFFAKWCVKNSSAVLAMSPNYALSLQEALGNTTQYFIVPNVVNTEVFSLTPYLSYQPKTKSSPFSFLHISGLHDPQKNITGILNSIKKLSDKRSDFLVYIVGDPEEQDKYVKLAKKLNIFDRFVFFQGWKTQPEIADMLQNMDTFLMFSHYEGLPCVILEAMAVGLPIIATETGGISEWVTSETGILVNIRDETGLVEAMNNMINNHSNYTPSVIRQKIVEKCSIEAVGKAIVTVYDKVLNN